LIATFTPLNSWWIGWLADGWDNPRGDVMVVLGGDSIDDRTLGEMSFWRCVYAVWLWREGHFREVIVSGGHDNGEPAIARPMHMYLVAHGIPAEAIRMDATSRSTRENALHVAAMIAPGSKPVLITSDFHMFRARRTFRKAGVEVVAAPIPDALKRNNNWRMRWVVFLGLAEETAKIAGYRWQGWMEWVN
jgi:uncharacterized SAM-binding protein YcdF (DUF218 family)